MKSLSLDNTRKNTFETCQRKYYYTYCKGYRSEYGSTALRYGSTWHGMKEGFYLSILKNGWKNAPALTAAIENGRKVWEEETSKRHFIDDYRTLDNAMLAFAMWIEHFAGDEGILEVVEPEVPFKLKVNLTKQEREQFPQLTETDLYFTGKIDLEVKLAGRYWITEDKTTGYTLNRLAEQLQRSTQLIGYVVAGSTILPSPPEGVLVTMHQLTARKSTKTGTYGEPKVDFSRVPQIFTDRDLADWRVKFLSEANDIVREHQRNLWPKDFNACFNYNRRCEYYNLCSQNVPLGEERLEGLFVDEPWDVLKDSKPREGEI